MTVHSRQMTFDDVDPEYKAFVEKFKPKKTTDDCYTPPPVYEAVVAWAEERYGIARENIVRPFYPGGDFQRFDYPAGCLVLDNPPFSILAGIIRFYLRHGVRFFLFCPALQLPVKFLSGGVTFVACSADIIYENGANVKTAFIHNLTPDIALETAPELARELARVAAAIRHEKTRHLPKLAFPPDVLTAARAGWLAIHGERFAVQWRSCCNISDLNGRSIYGGGLLLSRRAAAERAAAERAAAERAAAEILQLTPREEAIQDELDKREAENI